MKISILAIGRLKNGPERALFDRYCDLFNAAGRSLKLAPLTCVELNEARADIISARKDAEARDLLAKVGGGTRLIALDEHGDPCTSQQLAAMLSQVREGARDVAFVLGGPDGHGEEILKVAHGKLSLSRLTFPHGLARIVLAEQLYRALTILQGHPYHRN